MRVVFLLLLLYRHQGVPEKAPPFSPLDLVLLLAERFLTLLRFATSFYLVDRFLDCRLFADLPVLLLLLLALSRYFERKARARMPKSPGPGVDAAPTSGRRALLSELRPDGEVQAPMGLLFFLLLPSRLASGLQPYPALGRDTVRCLVVPRRRGSV